MSTTSTVQIVSDPRVRFGKPCIAGRRIAVVDIAVWHDRMGMSRDEISREYDLSFEEIDAALRYYFEHREDIDRRLAEGEAYAESLRKDNPSVLAKRLAERLGPRKSNVLNP